MALIAAEAAAATLPVVPGPDARSRAWVSALGGTGHDRDRAVAELHDLLLRAARFELGRRRGALRDLSAGDLEDLATQSAADALLAILNKLGDYRGASRFTTWAYKFALLEAGVKARRRAWQDRELPLPDEGWARLQARVAAPSDAAGTSELLAALRDAIREDLTPRQRDVLVALALNEVPIDVLAERLGATRGALYKSLHDARRRLRASMGARGLSLDPREEA